MQRIRARFEDLAHRHRDGLRRHLVDRGEPSLAHLLTPARLVQLHDEVWALGQEVCRRIVEGEMPVLADADKGDIDRGRPNRIAGRVGNRPRVVLAVEQVVRQDARRTDQPLEQIPAEARGMVHRETDVLVEVEHLHPRPVDPGRGHQRLEEFDLRRASRRDDARPRLRREHIGEDARRVRRRRAAHRLTVDERLYLH